MHHLQEHKDSLLPEFRKIWEVGGFKNTGTWEEVFGVGPKTDEIFMGWNYAHYVNRVANAGKAEYPLPMFVNAWIVQPQDKQPGDYPSGGPQGHMLDLWRAGAPKIDIYAPDIYLPNFTEVCEEFVRNGNPLFVPESRAGGQGVANCFAAVGQYGSIGYSPFGIEDRESDTTNGPLHHAYGILSELAPLILEHQANGTIAGVWLTQSKRSQEINMGQYTLTAALRTNRRNPEDLPAGGYGIVMQLGPDEFLVAGGNMQVTFAANSPGPEVVGLATVEEGRFINGKWVPGRTLNGDEVMISYAMANLASKKQTGTGLRFQSANPTIQRVKLYRYE
jgi:beta-galactosidase GanA